MFLQLLDFRLGPIHLYFLVIETELPQIPAPITKMNRIQHYLHREQCLQMQTLPLDMIQQQQPFLIITGIDEHV